MITPVNNIVSQEGDNYRVISNGNFNTVFGEKTLIFRSNGKTYLTLPGNQEPVAYQVIRWDTTPHDKPIEIRRASDKTVEKLRAQANATIDSYVNRVDEIIRPHVEKFQKAAEVGDVLIAEAEIKSVSESLDGMLNHLLNYSGPKDPIRGWIASHIQTTPEDMEGKLPEAYRKGVEFYMKSARKSANHGYPGSIEWSLNNAEYCARKSLQGDELKQKVKEIAAARVEYKETGESIKRQVETATSFGWRSSAKEAWRVAELGYDDRPQPTGKDVARINAARRSLTARGVPLPDHRMFQI